MQNNIPGPESLRNNNILLCKAKLGKSTHWSEKMVLAFTVVTVQSCSKEKKNNLKNKHIQTEQWERSGVIKACELQPRTKES